MIETHHWSTATSPLYLSRNWEGRTSSGSTFRSSSGTLQVRPSHRHHFSWDSSTPRKKSLSLIVRADRAKYCPPYAPINSSTALHDDCAVIEVSSLLSDILFGLFAYFVLPFWWTAYWSCFEWICLFTICKPPDVTKELSHASRPRLRAASRWLLYPQNGCFFK